MGSVLFKKGELSLEMIVIFIIVIIVLVVMMIFFLKHYGSGSETLAQSGKDIILDSSKLSP